MRHRPHLALPSAAGHAFPLLVEVLRPVLLRQDTALSILSILSSPGEWVKHHTVVLRHGPRRILVPGLALASLAVIALAACNPLRFPLLTPESPSPSEIIPISTPTLAPLLLTPVPTSTPEPTSAAASPSATPTFGLVVKPTCRSTPQWGLGDVWQNEAVYGRLGCPAAEQRGVQGEELYFQHGHMISRPEARLIYVFFDQLQPHGWGAYVDTFQPSDPDSDPSAVVPTPSPSGPLLVQPTGRFGKLWRENAWLRETLGWAVAPDPKNVASAVASFSGAVQDFERGVLFWNGNICFVLRIDDMSWDIY